MTTPYSAILSFPCCKLGIVTDAQALLRIDFLPLERMSVAPSSPIAEQVQAQLAAYLDDARFHFDLPLNLRGTLFQQKVWTAISAIPPGETLTYGELASEVGGVARAVGQACGANPIPIVVPCHRVLARNGVGGFSHRREGTMLTIKHWLLGHEGLARFPR